MGRASGGAERTTGEEPPASFDLAKLVRAARRTGRPIALDTPALIAYLEDREPAASLLAPLIEDPRVALAISVVTLAEVLTRPAFQDDRDLVQVVRESVVGLPGAEIVELSESIAIEIAFVRARTGLKLPDASIVASACAVHALVIIGNDARWKNRSLGVPYLHIDDLTGGAMV